MYSGKAGKQITGRLIEAEISQENKSLKTHKKAAPGFELKIPAGINIS